jgi:hypothetical protein
MRIFDPVGGIPTLMAKIIEATRTGYLGLLILPLLPQTGTNLCLALFWCV